MLHRVGPPRQFQVLRHRLVSFLFAGLLSCTSLASGQDAAKPTEALIVAQNSAVERPWQRPEKLAEMVALLKLLFDCGFETVDGLGGQSLVLNQTHFFGNEKRFAASVYTYNIFPDRDSTVLGRSFQFNYDEVVSSVEPSSAGGDIAAVKISCDYPPRCASFKYCSFTSDCRDNTWSTPEKRAEVELLTCDRQTANDIKFLIDAIGKS